MSFCLQYANRKDVNTVCQSCLCDVLSQEEISQLYDACVCINRIIAIKCKDINVENVIQKLNDSCLRWKDTSPRHSITLERLVSEYLNDYVILVHHWEKIANEYHLDQRYVEALNKLCNTPYYPIIRIFRNTAVHYSSIVDNINYSNAGIKLYVEKQKILDHLKQEPGKRNKDMKRVDDLGKIIEINDLVEKSSNVLKAFHDTLVKCLLDDNIESLSNIMKFYFKICPEKYGANIWNITKSSNVHGQFDLIDVRWNDYKNILKNGYLVDVEQLAYRFSLL